MYSRETAIALTQRFLKDCLQLGIKIEKAILFGSIAKNKQTENSDIDVALVSSMFGKNFITNNKMTSKININYPNIEIHHFNNDYFRTSNPFIDEINTTGIILA
jgi:predicted nucleotidyltransferase